MSRLPWADQGRRNLRDFGACPVCGAWSTSKALRRYVNRRGETRIRMTGLGPRTVLTHCGVRWRGGVRMWRSAYRDWQE